MSRGTLPGTLKAVALSSAPSSLAAPTVAEIGAGVDLIGPANGEGLESINGFIVDASTINTPDYRSHVVGNVPGDSTVQTSSMSFYKDDSDETIYSDLIEGNQRWIVLMFDGDSATDESQVWPVTVQTRFRRPARDQAHIFDVNMSTGTPTVGVVTA